MSQDQNSYWLSFADRLALFTGMLGGSFNGKHGSATPEYSNVENNNFFSNKEDKYNHGYGLKSIALCARQNNALYKASFNDINNEFETSILFQNILH